MVTASRNLRIRWFSQHNISLLMLVYLFASECLEAYAFWVVLFISAAYYVILHKGKIVIRSPWSGGIIIAMFTIGIFGAAAEFVSAAYSVGEWPFVRDIIKISAIPLTYVVCALLAEKESNSKIALYTTLYFFCAVYGIGSILLSIPNYLVTSQNLFSFASNLIDQWVAAIGVFLAFCKPPCIEKHYISRSFDFVAQCGLSILAAISFSRTVFVLLLCLLLPFFYNRLGKLIKFAVLVLIALIIVWNTFPNIAATFSDKVLRSFTEISSANAMWDDRNVVNNWRGYEVYCAQEQFSQYTLFEKMFGKGFGATVDAKGYAYLVTSEDSLPYLHNGYYTTLIKMGIVGVCLNISYWVALYKERKRKLNDYEKRNRIGLILAMASSMLVIHGIVWGGMIFIPFLLLEWE